MRVFNHFFWLSCPYWTVTARQWSSQHSTPLLLPVSTCKGEWRVYTCWWQRYGLQQIFSKSLYFIVSITMRSSLKLLEIPWIEHNEVCTWIRYKVYSRLLLWTAELAVHPSFRSERDGYVELLNNNLFSFSFFSAYIFYRRPMQDPKSTSEF